MDLDISDNLRTNLKWLGLTAAITVFIVALGNIHADVPDEQVGFTDVYTECTGIDVGICLGFESVNHDTVNYDEYETPDKGTENWYRMVEAELMAQAYNLCDDEIEGMEWTSEAEFQNRTGDEWLEEDQVNLLPCSEVTWRSIDE